MGGNYQKDLYKQLMEVMARVDGIMFPKELDHARNGLKRHGAASFHAQQLERFSLRYDELVVQGYEANRSTRERLAKKEEKALLNRLVKYKKSHLLFLSDFRVHYSSFPGEVPSPPG